MHKFCIKHPPPNKKKPLKHGNKANQQTKNKQTNKNKTKNKKSPQNQFFVKSILEHFQNTCFDTLKINNYYIIILKKTLH